MVLMVERNRGGYLIHRFAGRGNEPDPADVKIASLKQRIEELEHRQEKTIPKQAWETLNGKNPFLYVCDCGNHRGGVRKETLCRLGLQVEITECIGKVPSNYHGFLCSLGIRVSSPECVDKALYYPRFHGGHYDNPFLTMETESEPIIWDIGDEKEDYPFVNKYPKEDGDEDEVVYADHGEAFVTHLNVTVSKSDDTSWLRNNIFRTKCTIKGKACSVIIDGGSCGNMVATSMIEKLGLDVEDHTAPYQLTWLKKENVVKVRPGRPQGLE
ncbi:hypothetical protein Tco_0433079 [Tanacetum coccineum]